MTEADPFLVAAKIVLLLLGSSIAFVALLAYRRTGARLMGYLSVGFGLIALGSFLEGVFFELLRWDLLTVHVLESVFLLSGLLVLAIVLRPRRFFRR